MRIFSLLLLLSLVTANIACDDAPSTASLPAIRLGRTSLAEFRADPSNQIWFETAFEAYPGGSAEARERFNAATATIASQYDPQAHSVLMVVTPDCPCHSSQQLMPAVVKTLATAGVRDQGVTVYVTNAKMEGLDDLRVDGQPTIADAPAFIVLRNGDEKGRLSAVPKGSSVEQELARHFAVP